MDLGPSEQLAVRGDLGRELAPLSAGQSDRGNPAMPAFPSPDAGARSGPDPDGGQRGRGEAGAVHAPLFRDEDRLARLARGLAELTKGTAVTVNSLLPGPTLTENVKGLFSDVAEQQGTELEVVLDSYFDEEEPTSLIQRFEEPEEVARVAAFLCSDAAAIINGNAQRAEGGIIRSVL